MRDREEMFELINNLFLGNSYIYFATLLLIDQATLNLNDFTNSLINNDVWGA